MLEQGPAATGKDAISEEESQRKQYPSVREERAQPLHLRQRWRQEGSATLIEEKEQRAEALKTKDKSGATEEAAPIPTISTTKHGRLQEAVVWQKVAAQVQIGQLSQLGFLGLLLG